MEKINKQKVGNRRHKSDKKQEYHRERKLSISYIQDGW